MHDFPVDLPDAPEPAAHDFRWTASIIGLVAAGLLATNAISLSEWAGELPPSERVVRFVSVVDSWKAVTERTGLAAPRAVMHGVWKKLENARFPGQPPAAATSTTG